jgi:hypothetical protein
MWPKTLFLKYWNTLELRGFSYGELANATLIWADDGIGLILIRDHLLTKTNRETSFSSTMSVKCVHLSFPMSDRDSSAYP